MIPESISKLKEVREQTRELVKGRKQAELDRRPEKSEWALGEAGSWSAGELIDHIVRVMTSITSEIELLIELAEKGETPEVTRGLSDYDVAPALFPKPLMHLAEPALRIASSLISAVQPPGLREAFVRTRAFPIRNPPQWIPAPGRPGKELRSELQRSISRLEKLLTKHSEIDYDKLLLSHSFFGRHSVPQLLEILTMHEEWHHPDLETVLSRN